MSVSQTSGRRLVASVRRYCVAGDPQQGTADRTLADLLEEWLVAELKGDGRWAPKGRWNYGLLIDAVIASDAQFEIRASIFQIAPQLKHRAVYLLEFDDEDLLRYKISFYLSGQREPLAELEGQPHLN